MMLLRMRQILAFGDDVNKHYSAHDFRDILATSTSKPKNKADNNTAKPLLSHKYSGIEATI